MSGDRSGADEESPIAKVEEKLHEAAEEAEEAAWETVYEARDMAKDVIHAVTHPGANHKHHGEAQARDNDE